MTVDFQPFVTSGNFLKWLIYHHQPALLSLITELPLMPSNENGNWKRGGFPGMVAQPFAGWNWKRVEPADINHSGYLIVVVAPTTPRMFSTNVPGSRLLMKLITWFPFLVQESLPPLAWRVYQLSYPPSPPPRETLTWISLSNVLTIVISPILSIHNISVFIGRYIRTYS